MNSIDKNDKEKGLLKSIAGRKRDIKIVDEDIESYYLPSTQNTGLSAYGFSTIADFRKILLELWANDEKMNSFIPVVLAATFKNSPISDNFNSPVIEHKDETVEEVLPVYTYTL